jgi:F-type H+-transporting ATPase subunit delta
MEARGSYLEKTYASVLFELADQSGALDTVQGDLDCWTGICGMVKDFEKLILSPYFTPEYKQQFVRKILSGRIAELTMDFLSVVIRHNRAKILPDIIAEYNRLWDVRKGCYPVEVTVARQISDDETERLAADMAAMLNCRVKLELKVNPEILGGVIIRYDDKVVDNTIKGRLHKAVEAIVKHGKARVINEV